MDVTTLLAMLPRRAKKMTSAEAIYYMNYPVKEDMEPMVQAMMPSYYERNIIYTVAFPTMGLVSVADNGDGGSTCTVVATTLEDGGMVKISNSTDYDGTWQVFNTTTTTFDIPVAFSATAVGTIETDYLEVLPEDCAYPTTLFDSFGTRLEIQNRDNLNKTPSTIAINGTSLVIPIGATYSKVKLMYHRNIPLVVTVSDELPFPANLQRSIVPVLLYGMCLEFFRDRKKANDIQIYRDKYAQAKANIGRLSVMSLV